MKVIDKLQVRKVPIGSVTEHPENARRGDVEIIKESLAAHGQFAPIIVQDSTGYIIKGNHTHRAAVELGWKKVDVARVDVDDDQAKRILLVDNRSSDLGGYEEQTLTQLLASLNGDLVATGYEPGDLDARLAELSISDTQKPSAADALAAWEMKDARTILLTYSVADHARMCDQLDMLGERFGVDTYSAVVERLVADALG